MSQSFEELLEPARLETAARNRLARYGDLVLEANRHFNLTGAKSVEELATHFLDSLTVIPFVKEPYIDIGAGAGLPSIVVSIATGIPVTMIEATAKKARFLEEVLRRLGLRGEVIAQRAETAAHSELLRERFASGTARAVGSAPTVAELLLPFISVGGVAILQRGALAHEERQALEDASLMLGGTLGSEHPIQEGRCVLSVRKDRTTPHRFPRRPGVPAKRPLCLP